MTSQAFPDDERFAALFREHHPAVQAYVARRCADPGLGAQVVAETFTVAWRRLEAAMGGGRPWLFRTAHHCLANTLRAERRHTRSAARSAALTPTATPDPSELSTTSIQVRGVLSTLPARDREVLMLAYWEDLPTAEIGEVLGCSSGTAAARLHRARARFRRAVAVADGRSTTDLQEILR